MVSPSSPASRTQKSTDLKLGQSVLGNLTIRVPEALSPLLPSQRHSPKTALVNPALATSMRVPAIPPGMPTSSASQASKGRHGFAFASGLAAEDVLLRHLEPGDQLLLGDDAYGGTCRLIDKVHGRGGLNSSAVDLTDPESIRNAWTSSTRMVWFETPTNPLLTIIDIEQICAVVHELGGLVVVDNTFATPYLQQPISLGADAVVHSATKYLGGHSDVVGGVVTTSHEALAEHIGFVQNAVGAVAGPFDSYLVLRGIKSLAVRMDRHCENAATVVDLLMEHPRVSEVLYPGLEDHPGHDVAVRQMSGFGGMVSFRLEGGREAAEKLAMSTRVFTLAESLGAVESLIEHPGAMTHASAAGSALEVPDDLIRVSVGIESVDDLVADLDRALATV